MDTAAVIQTLLGIVIAGMGWWLKSLTATSIRQQELIARLEVDLARNYMPRHEMQNALERIFDALDEIKKEMVR